MKTVAQIEQELIAPGGAFEIVQEEVLGETIKVFRERHRCLRELVQNSLHHADGEYIVCQDQRITFAAHYQRVCAVANTLRDKYGVARGDRVAILADNHPEWIITFWATVSIGAICVALNGWWQREEILYGIGNSEPRLLLGDRKRLARIAGDTLPCPTVCIEDDFAALETTRDDGLPAVDIAEDDPAVILYTSGTTGNARGALLSHRNLLTFYSSTVFSGLRMMLLEMESGKAGDSAGLPHCGLFSAPLFHLSGLFTGAITSLGVGMKTVWTLGRFDPARILQLIEAEKVTTWPSLGSMAARVLDHPDFQQYDVSSVQRLGSGGAPTSKRQQQRMTRGFCGSAGQMTIGYGLTESTGVGTHNWGDLLRQHPEAVGRVFPGIEMSIRDEQNRDLPAGEQGEICIRGSCVMLGYWRNPEATAATMAPGGWLKTGDIGHFEDELLYINTRARDLILRNAENVYPVEVEHCLETHRAVVEAAVFGVPHSDWGEEVKAVVVVAAGGSVEVDALHAHCSARLAAFKVPTAWQIQAQPLPRNAAGKVLKNVLRGDADMRLVE